MATEVARAGKVVTEVARAGQAMEASNSNNQDPYPPYTNQAPKRLPMKSNIGSKGHQQYSQ